MSIAEERSQDDAALLALDDDFLELDQLGTEVLQLGNTAHAIETFGLNPAAVEIMSATGLLSGTSLNAIALESVNDNMALESILDSLKDKMTTWSAKVLNLFSETGGKVLTTLKGLWTRLKASTEVVKKKVFDTTDKAQRYAKAHPYKTLAAALTAAVAVTGIVAFAARGLPSYRNAKELPRFMEKLVEMIGKIRWPFGPVVPKLINGGKKIAVTAAAATAAAGVATIAKLGWSRMNVESLDHTFDKIYDGIVDGWKHSQEKTVRVLKDGWTIAKGMYRGITMGASVGYNSGIEGPHERMTNAENAKHMLDGVGGILLATFAVGVVSVGYVLYHLVRTIVCGAFRLVNATMNALSNSSPANEQYI